jgi:wyosine [tRNA(Phe)-imidazoG37] synthetase (radical SAM superfamily)
VFPFWNGIATMLNIHDHNRDSAGMKYVYPVVSRRAGGVSIGINLNVNNACNWACVYCQVPGLERGAPPPVDLTRLECELHDFFHRAISGDFLDRNVSVEFRRLVDLAFSGNGEPTSARDFPEAVEIAGRTLEAFGLRERLKLRVISNGSQMHKAHAQRGIARIGELDGEVWFKIDRGTPAGILQVNGTHTTPERIREAVSLCSERAPTWIQTCLFCIDGEPIDAAEFDAYLELIGSFGEKIEGVRLYGLARPSCQPEAKRLSAYSTESLSSHAQRITALGIRVNVNP